MSEAFETPAADGPDAPFAALDRVYGDARAALLPRLRLCVVGVGGVGSWAVEALARSAVGRITLIDPDHVAESNMNRQLSATGPDLGRAKVAVLAERVAAINPACGVDALEAFAAVDNLGELIAARHDWVIDCIDSFRVKAAMIAFCRRRGQRVISVGGAGGQRDATRVRVGDLYRTEQDPLLARTRRLLRREYGYPSNPKRRFGVPCIWSDEPQRAPPNACDAPPEGSLNCAGFGACMPVTATFGLVAAGYVINQLVKVGPGAVHGPVGGPAHAQSPSGEDLA